MGRRARPHSRTGIDHVMIRGVNKQNIFEREADGRKFLRIVAETKAKMPFQLHACCIMGNHIHLLVMQDPKGPSISAIMRVIVSQYVMWYNHKYDRVGNLFQDRFRSEVVEDINYYKTVFRYIHRNPIKAGLEKKLGEYRWNSYTVYQLKAQRFAGNSANQLMRYFDDWQFDDVPVLDTEFPELVFGDWNYLTEFCEQNSEEICMDMEYINNHEMVEESARRAIGEISGCHSVSDFQKLPKHLKKEYIRQLLERGLKKAQLRRLCGVSAYMIDSVAESM